MEENIKSTVKFRSLKKQLLFIVLGISTLVATITTALNFYLEYDEELDILKTTVKQIEKSTLPSLVNSIWQFDDVQTEILLEGMLASSDFVEVYIVSKDGLKTFSKKRDMVVNTITFKEVFPLTYTQGTRKEELGSLHIVLSKDIIFQRLKSKLYNLLVLQMVKVFLVSFFLLQAFSTMLTNRILKLEKFFTGYDWTFSKKDQNFDLGVKDKKILNEMDRLELSVTKSIDLMQENVEKVKELQVMATRQAEKERQFATRMSHELRTPLNCILGMSQLLEEQNLSDESKYFLKVQRKAADSLLSIINDILDFSQIESGILRVEKRVFNLANVISETVSMFEGSAKEKNIEIKVDFSIEEDSLFKSDANKLRQVLFNLIGNALKYSQANEIVVSTKFLPNKKVLLSVKDDGRGIPSDLLPVLFDPYSRGKDFENGSLEGSGLGLAITKEYVRLLGGEIHIDTTLGTHTDFQLSFDWEYAPNLVQNEVSVSEDLHDTQVGLPHLKILAVDDCETNLFLLKGFFRKTDVDLIYAKNGQEAFDMFQKEDDIDVVLMDIHMPVLNGLEATKKIREYEVLKNKVAIPIIALTAANDKKDVVNSHEAGCSLHINKPVKRKFLFSQIIKQIDRHQKEAS